MHTTYVDQLEQLATRHPDDTVVTQLHRLVRDNRDGRLALTDLIEACHDVDHPNVEGYSQDTVVIGGTVEVDLEVLDSPRRDAWQLIAAHADEAIVHTADRDDLLHLVDADFISQIDRAIARAVNADRDVQIAVALRVAELFGDASDLFDTAPDGRHRVALLVDAGAHDEDQLRSLIDRWDALPELARDAADELAADWSGPLGGFLDVAADSVR